MRVAFYTLGCKVNQYDTQLMRDRLEHAGYQTVSFEEPAEVYIVNTCTVTQISDKKSRQMISRAKRRHPGSILVVCGCFSQVAPEAACALEGVDIVLGTSNRKEIVRYLAEFQKSGKQLVAVENQSSLEEEQISSFGEKNRAILKIEDGCENFCSYCLIPFARGKIRSKPLDAVRKEAERLAAAGYQELVLTGIHLASYGKDWGAPCLEKAIETVAKIPTIARIRLGSLEPRIITPAFLDQIKKFPALCPHFHLSLQSGCDETLHAMRRHYTAAEYARAASLLKETFPDCALTTDLIVGFPGETEAQFEESLRFAQNVEFSKIHIFPYSPRKGTRAADMDGQLSKEVKEQRVKRMEAMERESRHAFWNSLIGTVQQVLHEEEKNGFSHGFTRNYCPVYWRGDADKILQYVRIDRVEENGLFGILI